jgi:hypothetical protein
VRLALCIIGLLAISSRINGDGKHTEIVISHECIKSVELGPETYCYGPDLHDMVCPKVIVHYTKGCEQVHVTHDAGPPPQPPQPPR